MTDTPATVAATATRKGALALNDTALIGTILGPNGRTALVRTARGKVVRLKPGDRIGRATITAIGEGEMHLVQNGRPEIRTLPEG